MFNLIVYLRRYVGQGPRIKALLKWVVRLLTPEKSVSGNYVQLSLQEAERESHRLRESWKAIDLPHKQRQLVNLQRAAFSHGEPVDVFDVMVRA